MSLTTVHVIGQNWNHQWGDNTARSQPVTDWTRLRHYDNAKLIQFIPGACWTIALAKDSTLWVSGHNSCHNLATDETNDTIAGPNKITFFKDRKIKVKRLFSSCQSRHVYAETSDGYYAW